MGVADDDDAAKGKDDQQRRGVPGGGGGEGHRTCKYSGGNTGGRDSWTHPTSPPGGEEMADQQVLRTAPWVVGKDEDEKFRFPLTSGIYRELRN